MINSKNEQDPLSKYVRQETFDYYQAKEAFPYLMKLARHKSVLHTNYALDLMKKSSKLRAFVKECEKKEVVRFIFPMEMLGTAFFGIIQLFFPNCCQHKGCNNEPMKCECWDETSSTGYSYEYYCGFHASEYGYCPACGTFIAGIKDQATFCDNCHSELQQYDHDEFEESLDFGFFDGLEF